MNSADNITRSEFLREGLRSVLKIVAQAVGDRVDDHAKKIIVPLLRPPGALDELAFLTKCTRCDLCSEACPHDAIVKADAKYGAAVGTPMIEPAKTPCYLCSDMPCISACPEEALLPSLEIDMGTAYIARNKCFVYNGQVPQCDYCFQNCPLKNEAITMSAGKPEIVESVCVGCGICEYYCPAPGKAIRIVARPA